MSIDCKQLFRQSQRFNGDAFLEFLKTIHSKFPKCHLFMDKASPHYRSRKVRGYFEENNDTLIPVYLPSASPEFMVMDAVWNIAKRDLLLLNYYPSFSDFKNRISCYFRTKRFNLDMINYLLRWILDNMLIGILYQILVYYNYKTVKDNPRTIKHMIGSQ